ncbi:MAG: hypothetical protein SGBAC_004790 [Bacillariaceae sp.]
MESGKMPDGKPEALDSSASSRPQARNAASHAIANPSDTSAEAIVRSNAVEALLPDDKCILFGRGKSCNNHTGNIEMRRIVERYRDQYQMSVRGEKNKLVRKVYDELVDAGMKFLKPAESQDGWVEGDAEDSVQKVGHALRSSRSGRKNPKAAKSEQLPVETLQQSSAPSGIVQEQLVGLEGLPGWSTQMATGLPLSGGLVQESASELLRQHVQGQVPSLQGLTSFPTPGERGAVVNGSLLAQGTVGTERNGVLNQLMREMESERLRSWLLGPDSAMAFPRVLSALTANELYDMAERDDHLRQLLLHYLARKTGT